MATFSGDVQYSQNGTVTNPWKLMIIHWNMRYTMYTRYTGALVFRQTHILSNPTGGLSPESIRRAAVPVQAALYRSNFTVQTGLGQSLVDD